MVKRFVPEEVWIERSELDTPIARTVMSRLADQPINLLEERQSIAPESLAAGKRRLVLQRHRGNFLRHCPAGTEGLICCNYLVVDLATNCPLDCSYCFLQEYLANNPALKAFTNVDDALVEIDAVLRAHPERTFRVGTGDLADSLALDPVTGLSQYLVPFFAERPNAVLELKTKTNCVDDLVALRPGGKVVVSWSVNAEAIIDSEEPGAASLAERLAAARRVQDAGYRLGFHFDPLIEFDGWERGYRDAVHAVFSAVNADAVAWVSLGSLRMTPALARAIRARRSSGHVLAGELVPCADGKARIWRGLRLKMYRFLVEELRAVGSHAPLYLCMESPSVWGRVMREVPTDGDLEVRLAPGAPR